MRNEEWFCQSLLSRLNNYGWDLSDHQHYTTIGQFLFENAYHDHVDR